MPSYIIYLLPAEQLRKGQNYVNVISAIIMQTQLLIDMLNNQSFYSLSFDLRQLTVKAHLFDDGQIKGNCCQNHNYHLFIK